MAPRLVHLLQSHRPILKLHRIPPSRHPLAHRDVQRANPTARTYTPTVGNGMRITRKSLTTFSGARTETTILRSLFTLVVIAYPTHVRLRAACLEGQNCSDWRGCSQRSSHDYYATVKWICCDTGHSALLLRQAQTR